MKLSTLLRALSMILFWITPVAFATELVCESSGGKHRYCEADVSGKVRMVEQLSRSACVYDQSWGYDREGVWVDEGCRARFRLVETVSVTCSSDGGRHQRCAVENIAGAELEQQLSRSACDRGSSWGYDREGIWVDKGCRARFEVEVDAAEVADSGTGASTGAGAGAGTGAAAGPGASADGTITCESQGGRYQHCAVVNLGEARLIEQLSRSSCDEGSSWGTDDRGIWVDKGCRARFELTQLTTESVSCSSDGGRYRHCAVTGIYRAELAQQLSRSACVRDSSWGEDEDGVWVSEGCRARFTVHKRVQ